MADSNAKDSLDPVLKPFIEKIELAETRDAQIDALEAYVIAFDDWLANAVKKKTNEELSDVLRIHQELIAVVTDWLKSEGEEFKAHKAKAKAIMAYADQLPKKLSRYRPLKG